MGSKGEEHRELVGDWDSGCAGAGQDLKCQVSCRFLFPPSRPSAIPLPTWAHPDRSRAALSACQRAPTSSSRAVPLCTRPNDARGSGDEPMPRQTNCMHATTAGPPNLRKSRRRPPARPPSTLDALDPHFDRARQAGSRLLSSHCRLIQSTPVANPRLRAIPQVPDMTQLAGLWSRTIAMQPG